MSPLRWSYVTNCNCIFYLFSDFAARNCLLMSDMTLKIGDYGIGEDLFRVNIQLPKFKEYIHRYTIILRPPV